MNENKLIQAVNKYAFFCKGNFAEFIFHGGAFKYLNVNKCAIDLKNDLSDCDLSAEEAKFYNGFIDDFQSCLSRQLSGIITSGPDDSIRKETMEFYIKSVSTANELCGGMGVYLPYKLGCIAIEIYDELVKRSTQYISGNEKSKPIIEILEKDFTAKEFVPIMDELSVRLHNVIDEINEDNLNVAIVQSFAKLVGGLMGPMLSTYGIRAMTILLTLGSDDFTKDFDGTTSSINPGIKSLIEAVVGSENIDAVLKSGVRLYNSYKPLSNKIACLQHGEKSSLNVVIRPRSGSPAPAESLAQSLADMSVSSDSTPSAAKTPKPGKP